MSTTRKKLRETLLELVPVDGTRSATHDCESTSARHFVARSIRISTKKCATRWSRRASSSRARAAAAQCASRTPTRTQTSLHLRWCIAAIYDEGELEEASTCKPYLRVRQEGVREVRRSLKHYSLPMILAVGFRVRSHRGAQFRRWANERLEEYLVKGFVMVQPTRKRSRRSRSWSTAMARRSLWL